jgi:FKBP-type peptidyl-prolyl cis-trans isomerase FklB
VSQVYGQEKLVLKNQKEKVSYIIGMDIGSNLKKQSIDVDPNILAKGMKDAFLGEKPLLTEQEIQETMVAFQKEMMAKQAEVAKKKQGGRRGFPC